MEVLGAQFPDEKGGRLFTAKRQRDHLKRYLELLDGMVEGGDWVPSPPRPPPP